MKSKLSLELVPPGNLFEFEPSPRTIRSSPVDARLKDFDDEHLRMTWAARRKTMRVEDIAYSLMGIFDVSLQTTPPKLTECNLTAFSVSDLFRRPACMPETWESPLVARTTTRRRRCSEDVEPARMSETWKALLIAITPRRRTCSLAKDLICDLRVEMNTKYRRPAHRPDRKITRHRRMRSLAVRKGHICHQSAKSYRFKTNYRLHCKHHRPAYKPERCQSPDIAGKIIPRRTYSLYVRYIADARSV
ncbi:hypothetical protein DFH29DRAFT_999703 [Suillus ampliporus]|nr:hypothetical protein DFH29DRAFT_999703 [Suillus ampliporus]